MHAVTSDSSRYLQPGVFVDSDHPAVVRFAREQARGATDIERAVALYYAVRDGIRYNPFQNFTLDESFRASACLANNDGWCVPKAALYAACARVIGIPARVGFADVKNHLTSPRLQKRMGTDLFVYHGYAELLLAGQWVKATPVFDLPMCAKFRVKPLEFDGRSDALFHPFDEADRRHMEYVRFHGAFDDVPAEEIKNAFRATYPELYNLGPDAHRETF